MESSKEPSVFLFSHRGPGAERELSDAADRPRRAITHHFIKARMALIAGGCEGGRGPHVHTLQRVDSEPPQRE